jgi:hypothetical protein
MTTDNSTTKTVTIRGVDKELYEKFSRLSSHLAPTIGSAFSILANTFGKEEMPGIFRGPIRRVIHHLHSSIRTERIRNLDKLVVSKEDLIAGGKDVQYVFHNIGELIFDKSVDNTTFLQYIHRINNCHVKAEGKLSRLFLESIDQSTLRDFPLSGEFKDVTIRNVDASVYDEFVLMCQQRELTIGEGMNELLQRFIPRFEVMTIITRIPAFDFSDTIVLSMRDNIDVHHEDLLQLEHRKILFHRVNSVKFDPDIPNQLFIDKVIGIYYAKNVILPPELPKLIALSRVVEEKV